MHVALDVAEDVSAQLIDAQVAWRAREPDRFEMPEQARHEG